MPRVRGMTPKEREDWGTFAPKAEEAFFTSNFTPFGQERRSEDAEAPKAPPWPELAPQALHGPIGDLVRLIEPHTEADPVAILVQALVAFGAIVGRGPHYRVEGDEHHGNLFAVLVGGTAKGRKGSSWGQVRRVFKLVDEEWERTRVHSGLSSGEGLIWPVRDPIEKSDGEVTDPGITDKRLLVVEPELARLFQVLCRSGNTLSSQLRDAWDRGRLQSMTKNSPAVATGAHVSIIGHITRDELLRHLGETEAGNGFGNRFLWLLVRRSKVLPWGGRLHQENLVSVVHDLCGAVEHARTFSRLEPTPDARVLWERVYPILSEAKPGLLGSMIARAEAQVMRLALVYALADQADEIHAEHLTAALALWDYAEASARYVFGEALGDPVADEILAALRSSERGELARDEIRELFSRHKLSSEIGRALRVLEEHGLVQCHKRETGGRPAEVWTLVAGYRMEAAL